MAVLEDLRTGERRLLAARHLVGRSPNCHLRVDRPDVSGVHAEIVWDGASWQVQDLGSRNGTFVDGRKLGGGERAAVQSGCVLAFGVPADRHRMVDDDPPVLMAISRSGATAVGEDEMLSLPSLEYCEASIFRNGMAGWVAESSDKSWEIEDQEVVVVGGEPWRVCLPTRHQRTTEAQAEDVLAPHAEVGLELFVSRDGEHISMKVVSGREVQELEARAHLALMLELARVRLSDAEREDLPPSEHGWIHRDDLLKRLGIDQALLNLWAHRSRQQLAKVRSANCVIERRVGTHQLRIGIERLRIEHA